MAERNYRRTILRKARIEGGRIDAFVADYVKRKNSTLYKEAKEMYDVLRLRYPNKLNLKKTREYETWKDHGAIDLTGPFKKQPIRVFKDTLQLEIPLVNIKEGPATVGEDNSEDQATVWEDTDKEQTAVGEDTVEEQVIDEGESIIPSLNVPLSDETIEGMIKDLQADPLTRDILTSFEEEFDMLGMDIDLEDDNILEREIVNW